jgi:putative DNA primase/helicase
MKDYYAALGVRPDATAAQIKAAYRKLARKLHPDANAGDPVVEALFKLVTEAYDVLGDEAKRRIYDTQYTPASDAPRAADYADEDDDRVELPGPGAPYEVAKALYRDGLLGERLTQLLAWRGGWMTWHRTHWAEIDEAELRQAIYETLSHAAYLHPIREKGITVDYEKRDWDPNKHKICDVMEALAAVTQLSRDTDPPSWLLHSADARTIAARHDIARTPAAQVISCRNGLLDLSARALHDHTAALFNLICVPLDYHPDPGEPAEWLDFLASVWGEDADSIALLQEYFGYILSGRLDMQKALLLVGPIRSGKGTIERVMTALMGHNIASPTLAGLNTNFGLSPLIGKPLAFVTDARLGNTPSHVVVERLLSITGEDWLTIDRKYREPWTGKLPTRFVILSNELPKFRDSSGAIATRLLILKMTESFLGREDHELDVKLRDELGAILVWALEGLDRLTRKGRFTEPQSSRDAAALVMDLASPVSAFVRERCLRAPDAIVARDRLYAAWKMWAFDNGHKPGANSTFGRDLRAAVPEVRDFRRRVGGRQIHTYTFIGLKPDSPDSPDEHAGQDDFSQSGCLDSLLGSFLSETGESEPPDSLDDRKPLVSGDESGESGSTPNVHLTSRAPLCECGNELLSQASLARGYCERCHLASKRNKGSANE